ncbi:54S ribosomal protein L4 mitochondrial [Malassezia psittaci]|uniref:Large ribosomal subunit protein uL29m n=1 Tax=Malassezia psittaci TaxID=1821823 RepID=A0AAF0F3N5_9BASI|nr:54S ribosomal protein L4 mitochondrial [Malassezia psittaci]
MIPRPGPSARSLAAATTRQICTSSACAQAPRPPKLVPYAHVLAGTATPKTPIDVARIYPDHPLMRFFQRVPVEVPKAGTQGKHSDERDTLQVPQAVTESDLGKDYSSRSWLAPELRRKSSVDLHNLWYVLLIERNRLATSWEEIKRHNAEGAAHMLGESLSYRHHRFVLNERRLALIEAQKKVRQESITPSLGDDGELFEAQPSA